jgi:hypothetical protein
MPRADLEQLVHDDLRRLPMPLAPITLLPRVLAAVQHWTLRPWYQRAWFTWPIGWQVISLAALVGFVGAAVVISPAAEYALAATLGARTASLSASIAQMAGHAETLAAAARIIWRSLGAPLAPYAFVVVALMGAACAAFGTALNRVVFERT